MFKMKHVCIFQKRAKNPRHSKSAYLSNYLNKKQEIKQFENAILQKKHVMVEKMYL
jgi:hypothetical protein